MKFQAEGKIFEITRTIHSNSERSEQFLIKFIYSEKAAKFCKIFTLLLSYVVPVKNKVKILQNFVAFSEYNDFNRMIFLLVVEGFSYLLRYRRGQEKNIGPGKFADMNKCRALTDKNLIRDVEYKNKIDQN